MRRKYITSHIAFGQGVSHSSMHANFTPDMIISHWIKRMQCIPFTSLASHLHVSVCEYESIRPSVVLSVFCFLQQSVSRIAQQLSLLIQRQKNQQKRTVTIMELETFEMQTKTMCWCCCCCFIMINNFLRWKTTIATLSISHLPIIKCIGK